jgi:hypothetical protein
MAEKTYGRHEYTREQIQQAAKFVLSEPITDEKLMVVETIVQQTALPEHTVVLAIQALAEGNFK